MLNRIGRSKEKTEWLYSHIRTPMMYCHPKEQSSWLPWKKPSLVQGSSFLENTNETFHSSLRYRHYCSNQDKLGPDDQGPYETKSMDGWTWPAKQAKGQTGSEESSASASEFAFSRSRGKETVRVKESSMGYYERLLLAIYDQDQASKDKQDQALQDPWHDYRIWKKVIGDSG